MHVEFFQRWQKMALLEGASPQPLKSYPPENAVPDPLHSDMKYMQDLYSMADPEYIGRWTGQ
jgi:hypothetical protein